MIAEGLGETWGAGTVRKVEKVQGEWETARLSIGPLTFVGVSAGRSDELGEHLAKIQRGAAGELGAEWEEVGQWD